MLIADFIQWSAYAFLFAVALRWIQGMLPAGPTENAIAYLFH